MTTQSLINIIPPIVAAGAVLTVANVVFKKTAANRAWPRYKIRTYKISWERRQTKGTRIVYGPNSATAVRGFEEKYPDREVVDVEQIRG